MVFFTVFFDDPVVVVDDDDDVDEVVYVHTGSFSTVNCAAPHLAHGSA